MGAGTGVQVDVGLYHDAPLIAVTYTDRGGPMEAVPDDDGGYSVFTLDQDAFCMGHGPTLIDALRGALSPAPVIEEVRTALLEAVGGAHVAHREMLDRAAVAAGLRNRLLVQAAAGASHERIAGVLGVSRGRISQLMEAARAAE